MIYTIRTTTGREDIVVDLLESRLKAEQGLDIKTIFHPAEIKGYVFIEGNLTSIHKAMVGLMHAKGLMEKPVALDEIKHFLEVKKTRIKIDIDDVVEIIGGPFKGERGKIKRIDSVKDEVTIELLEAAIPIPVTIATEFIKVVKKAHPEAAAEKETLKAEEKESEKSIFDNIKESAKSEAIVESKGKSSADAEGGSDSGEVMNDESSAEAGAQDEADKAEEASDS
ncbi:MAG: transcription elongation factor Spt5 [Candidatus Aenigmarchaeota archaeon]|nr:transcription elongation factor Spt5 [Candidatus Aenigmarchaeota archaeon]